MKKFKNKFGRIFACVLTLILAAFMALTGCGDGGGGGGNNGGNNNDGDGKDPNVAFGNAALTVDKDSPYTGGTHTVNISPISGKYLVKEGKTDYVIVFPAAATARENTAVAELQTYFQAATGIVLTAIPDTAAEWSVTAHYISVGKTSLVESANISVNADVLGQTGVRVATAGESVFLTGAGDYGTLYAVYEFLGYVFDWEAYSDTVITHHTGVTEVPDFEYNVASHQYIRTNEDLRNRFRMIQLQDQAFGFTDNIYHNSLEWISYGKYSSHPDWYSTYGHSTAVGGGNLCYNARGNKSEYNALVAEVAKLMKERVKVNPGKIYISFGIQDTQTLCECSACKAMREKYNGSDAASVILMLNDVYDILNEWFEGEGAEYYCGQKILFFAYHATNKPPVKLNEATGEYEALPIDPEDPSAGTFDCENIVPWFAETNGDYLYSLLENGNINKAIADNLKGWGAISDEILFWTYGTNFSEYLTPYYSFEGFQETYRFAAQEGVRMLYAQHQTNNANSTGWERLKGYLNYKLGWNVNYNVNELINRFFVNYFGPAANEMLDMFGEYRIVGHTQRENGYAVRRSIFANPFQAKYWPRNSLADWKQNVTAALSAIEPLRETDEDMYKVYYSNIATERVWVNYLMVNLYASSLSGDTVTEYRKEIKEDCMLAGIDRWKENGDNAGTISALCTQWGL